MAKKTGPKSKITEAIVDKFVQQIRDGLSTTGAAGAAGIPRSTATYWIRRGYDLEERGVKPRTKAERLYLQMAVEFRTARAEMEWELVRVIRGASRGEMRGDWVASKFLLERRYQRDWCRLVQEAKREGVDLALEHIRDVLTEEQYEEVRRRLARAALEG